MSELSILILSDGRPGHYHLADGVVAALQRMTPVMCARIELTRRRLAPNALLAALLGRSAYASALRLGYGLTAAELPPARLIVSAGGDTLAANVAVARHLGAENIFCGTLRRLPPSQFSLVVSSYARHAGLPRHIVALKPNGMDPDTLARARAVPDASRPPRLAGLLVGGNSGLFRYEPDEWAALAAFLETAHTAQGIRWIVSTSRRTPPAVADALARLASRTDGPIAELIDFRVSGPGTLPSLLASVEAVLCTEDSSTMISEAVCARLPVVGVSPRDHSFKPEEAEYRRFMQDSAWCRFLPLASLTPDRFCEALRHIVPMRENHLDRLAGMIAERLPALFPDHNSASGSP
ncbi:MAG: ELM1/GtrOC1 family putative glycosyltransferase [Hyphomicrobiaceae bacterium]